MRLRTKLAALAVTAGVALTATAAFAYWTTSGSGSGSASAAAGNSAAGGGTGVTVAQDGPTTGLVPGGTAKAVNVKVTNSNPGSVSVGAVTAVITTGWSVDGGDNPDCTADDFTISGSSAPAGVLAAGATSGSLSGINIALNNGAGNQDACKGASPTLVFSAAAGS